MPQLPGLYPAKENQSSMRIKAAVKHSTAWKWETAVKHDTAGNKGRLGTKAQPAKERKGKLEAAGRQCSAGFLISGRASSALAADGTGKER